MTSSETLDVLFAEGRIRAVRGALFDSDPGPMPPSFTFDQVEGMLLGLAIGDSLGLPTEGLTTRERRHRHGEIRDFGPGQIRPSDDTQLAAWTIEHLLAQHGRLDPDGLGKLFASRRIRGIGHTVKGFITARKSGVAWPDCGPRSAGNGALMRIAPVLLPHLRRPSPELWADAALAAMITHNDSASITACVGFVKLLWELLRADGVPPRGWVTRCWLDAARQVELDDTYKPRGGRFAGTRSTLTEAVERYTTWASDNDATTLTACDAWFSGAFLLETMPSVLWILERHLGDPKEAIVRAVNDTKDNDTVAAIVGAAVGALHGRAGLPDRWVRALPGATTYSADDPGRLQELIQQARAQFWPT